MRLIKVKYTKAHTAGLVGECRDLDPDTGNVYEDGYSKNCDFKRTAPGVWSNGLSELTEIGGAPTTATVSPRETQEGGAPTTATVSPWETQEGGAHYKGLAIQPMRYSLENKLDAAQHTAIKYITRFRDKGGIADLRKAIHSIELLIAHEESLNGK